MRPFNTQGLTIRTSQSRSSPTNSPRRSPSSRSKLFIDPETENLESTYADPRKELLSPGWRRPNDPMVGYAGHAPDEKISTHVLDSPLRKSKIGGYSGFMPQTKNICGTPIIPFQPPRVDSPSQQFRAINKNEMMYSPGKPTMQGGRSSLGSPNGKTPMSRVLGSPGVSTSRSFTPDDGNRSSPSTFRNFAKHMDIEERYANAVYLLQKEHNQTQETLLHMLQAKLSEKLMSYAQQTIRTRKLFEAFDKNNDGLLDENDFRDCLENVNVQFDDVQILALFAYFDRKNSGFIEWEQFAEHSMVYNPKGGTAVLPKMITQTSKK